MSLFVMFADCGKVEICAVLGLVCLLRGATCLGMGSRSVWFSPSHPNEGATPLCAGVHGR